MRGPIADLAVRCAYSKVEQFRMPQILANPEFIANPFQTIRTHAKNTLIQHQPPSTD
ncbi:hypothetical protein OF83DRAFT_1140909 [Amylostereum chailletii]|nr:hypothetical protein OF83DRAFT_1140909 [Amylostereum chailletii]